MVIWKKKEETSGIEVPARIKNMHTSDLLAWMDVCLMQTGATFDKWRSDRTTTSEMDMSITTLHQIWHTLKERS
jgi:hypothetical protein